MKKIEQAKEAAAVRAVELVRNNSVIGLGSGSTMEYFIKELGRKIAEENYDIKAIATSYETQFLAHEYKIPIVEWQTSDKLDITVDGADEIDLAGNAVKGKGGAQTLEKIAAAMAECYILIADETKLVESLGKQSPVPIEVLPQAVRFVKHRLEFMGCQTAIRNGSGKVGPVITDLGNIIIDAHFEVILNAAELEEDLNNIPGVVGNGLFVNMADKVITGFIRDGRTEVKVQNFENRKRFILI